MNFDKMLAQWAFGREACAARISAKEFWPQMLQISADEPSINKVSERIIGYAFQVLNTLGPGSPEKIYGNALAMSWASVVSLSCNSMA